MLWAAAKQGRALLTLGNIWLTDYESDEGGGEGATPTTFLGAIDQGDLAAAAALLRERARLTRDEIEELADLLDPLVAPTQFSPYKLKAFRTPGKPPLHPHDHRMHIQMRISVVERLIRQGHKVEYAFDAAAAELGVGRTTIMSAWKKRDRIKRFKPKKVS